MSSKHAQIITTPEGIEFRGPYNRAQAKRFQDSSAGRGLREYQSGSNVNYHG